LGLKYKMEKSSSSTLLLTGRLRDETATPRPGLSKKEWRDSKAKQRTSLGTREPSGPRPLWIREERSPGTSGPEERLGRICPSAGRS